MSCITANDMLPIDSLGHTSMVIADIRWSDNNLYAVIGFAAGYFCVMSRIGHLIEIVSASNYVQFFYGLKIDNLVHVSIKGNCFHFFSKSSSIVCQAKELINEFNFQNTPNPIGRLNNLLHSIVANPGISMKEKIMENLLLCIREEGIQFKDNSEVLPILNNVGESSLMHFANPFPGIPQVEGIEVVKNTLKFIEPLRWRGTYSNNILGYVITELENSLRVLMQSTSHIKHR